MTLRFSIVLALLLLAGAAIAAPRWHWIPRPRATQAASVAFPGNANCVIHHKWDVITNASGQWMDYSPSGTNYAYSGAGSAAPQWLTNGMRFAGAQYAITTNYPIRSMSNYCFSVWTKATNASASYSIAFYNGGLSALYQSGGFGYQAYDALNAVTTYNTNWIHWVVANQGGPPAASVTYIYTNAVFVKGLTNNVIYQGITDYTTYGSWAKPPRPSYAWQGDIGEVAVWTNWVPTVTDVTNLYTTMQHP